MYNTMYNHYAFRTVNVYFYKYLSAICIISEHFFSFLFHTHNNALTNSYLNINIVSIRDQRSIMSMMNQHSTPTNGQHITGIRSIFIVMHFCLRMQNEIVNVCVKNIQTNSISTHRIHGAH